jgi:hypothetical protein
VSRYIEILAQGDPAPYGIDISNRVMFSLNFRARVDGPAYKLEEEIARILYDAGFGALATDMFIGPAAVVPATGPGPFTTILRTGGMSPSETHNGDKDARPSFQIIVRAVSYIVARNRAMAIWETLDGKRNVTVTVP